MTNLKYLNNEKEDRTQARDTVSCETRLGKSNSKISDKPSQTFSFRTEAHTHTNYIIPRQADKHKIFKSEHTRFKCAACLTSLFVRQRLSEQGANAQLEHFSNEVF